PSDDLRLAGDSFIPDQESLTITVALDVESQIVLTVESAFHSVVRSLEASPAMISAGIHVFTWAGRNMLGQKISAGTYTVRLVTAKSDLQKSVSVLTNLRDPSDGRRPGVHPFGNFVNMVKLKNENEMQIKMELTQNQPVELTVYDLQGRQVRKLIDQNQSV